MASPQTFLGSYVGRREPKGESRYGMSSRYDAMYFDLPINSHLSIHTLGVCWLSAILGRLITCPSAILERRH